MTIHGRIAAVMLAAVALALAGAAALAGAPATMAQEGRGRDLYLSGCSGCHGVDGLGTDLGPPLVGAGAAGADFMLSTGRMPLDDPDAPLRRKPPAYSQEDIRLLTVYVASLGFGPTIPSVRPEEGDLAGGRQLFTSNCGACHSFAAAGGAVGRGLEAPSLDRATPVEIAEAIRIGPGTMPLFGAETLSDGEVNSIVRYALHLRSAGDPGGWGLGRVGPIPEGFVAWIFGLGALLLAARWIGERE